MKRNNLLIACLAAMSVLAACNSGGQKGNDAQSQQNDSINSVISDSLATAMAERDTLMALMNDVSDGLTQIKQMENIVAQGNLNGETMDKKVQLRNDMEAIQRALQERSNRLDKLEARLSKSTSYNDEMKEAIQKMRQQLTEQSNTINDLTQQLAAGD